MKRHSKTLPECEAARPFLTVVNNTTVIVRLQLQPRAAAMLRSLLKYEKDGPITPGLEPVFVDVIQRFLLSSYAAAEAAMADFDRRRGQAARLGKERK